MNIEYYVDIKFYFTILRYVFYITLIYSQLLVSYMVQDLKNLFEKKTPDD